MITLLNLNNVLDNRVLAHHIIQSVGWKACEEREEDWSE